MIAIVSISDDVHALAVQRAVRAQGYRECHVIETDRIAQRDFLTYGIGHAVADRVLTSEGTPISLRDVAAVWLRRIRSPQRFAQPVGDDDARGIIDNDCRGGFAGYMATHFHGRWISSPDATIRASDKLGQLEAAHACGFRVPRTLVSQSREEVLDFYESCSRRMVVKTVVGAPGPFLQTVEFDDPSAFEASSFEVAPAIFQERIDGRLHLRVHCFGADCFAALIQSADLDWRSNLNVPISEFAMPPALADGVRRVLDHLELAMGIVDIKLTPDQEPVWLEVNPQGQFLFLDALTDLNLAQKLGAYLVAEAGER